MLLGFHASIENGAVPALTQDVLVQTSLAALALHPQIAVLLLQSSQLLFALNVDLLHFVLAVITNNILVTLQQIFTSEA